MKGRFFAAVLIVCSFIFVLPALFAQDSSKVSIQDVKGDVQITRAGQTQGTAAVEGDVIHSNDKVQTGANGSAKINIEETGELMLNNNTTWSYQAYMKGADKTTFSAHLAIGRLKAKVKKLPKESVFEIKTPTSVAAVRGTWFDLFVYLLAQHYFTQLDVFKDSVAFSNLFGTKTQIVNKGQSSVGDESGNVTPPKPIGSKSKEDQDNASGNPPGGDGSGSNGFPTVDDFKNLTGHQNENRNRPPDASAMPHQRKFIGDSSDSNSSGCKSNPCY